jgi:hypothetical protein
VLHDHQYRPGEDDGAASLPSGRYLLVPRYLVIVIYVESTPRQLAVDIIQGYLGYSSAGLRRWYICTVWLSTSRKIAEHHKASG